ncbi:glycosyltransferase involved in cell wall biosynthesis [Aeromicrobium fastidiosum]|nr:glycosyltransferase involved in cell wall biosynthesis [Aeromicrobium fastidiosum]
MLFLAVTDVRKSKRPPLIFDQHDLGPELVRAKRMPLSWLFVAIAMALEMITYRLADHVIATNQSYKSVATSRGKKRPDQVTIVRSGPQRSWIQDVPPTLDWHRNRRFLVAYVGVMGRQEGIDYLLESVRHLVEQGLDVHLALVGSGPDVERLKSNADRLGVSDRTEFHGRLPDEELRSILANSDVCVNPDEVNELNDLSTMNKILEYMALSRPIVQFDVREGRFSAGDASLYADANDSRSFADQISIVLRDPGLAEKMGRAGHRRFTGELCWEAQVPLLVEAYQTVLEIHD